MSTPVPALKTGTTFPEAWISKRNEMIQGLYRKFFKQVKFYILNNSGMSEDAEDVFQDALIILINKMDNGTLNLSCSVETFLFSVCKNLWFHHLSRMHKVHEYKDGQMKEHIISAISAESYDVHDELLRLMRCHFSRLDSASKQTLELYLSKTPNKETTSMLGYKNKHYAKTRKFVCKERLKSMIMKDPEYKKLEFEIVE